MEGRKHHPLECPRGRNLHPLIVPPQSTTIEACGLFTASRLAQDSFARIELLGESLVRKYFLLHTINSKFDFTKLQC